MAATSASGHAGLLISVADAAGYVGSAALLLVRNFVHLSLDWSRFLCAASYVVCVIGLAVTVVGWFCLGKSMAAPVRRTARGS